MSKSKAVVDALNTVAKTTGKLSKAITSKGNVHKITLISKAITTAGIGIGAAKDIKLKHMDEKFKYNQMAANDPKKDQRLKVIEKLNIMLVNARDDEDRHLIQEIIEGIGSSRSTKEYTRLSRKISTEFNKIHDLNGYMEFYT